MIWTANVLPGDGKRNEYYICISSICATGYSTYYFTNSCSVWQKFQVALWKLSVAELCHFEPFSLTSYSGSKNPSWAGMTTYDNYVHVLDVHAHVVWLGFKWLFSSKFFISVLHPETLARVSKISSCLVLILYRIIMWTIFDFLLIFFADAKVSSRKVNGWLFKYFKYNILFISMP